MLLDNLRIMRFSHSFESGGGVEQYIEDLDTTILNRSKVTILRMYLTRDSEQPAKVHTRIGQGELIKIPLITRQYTQISAAHGDQRGLDVGRVLRNNVRDNIVYNNFFLALLFQHAMRRFPSRSKGPEGLNAGKEMHRILKEERVDLLVMHYVGGRDSESIISVARSNDVPFIYINHFSNDRLNHASVRVQTSRAAGIAGVSSVDVPERLKDKFTNLSDGVDTEYFKPELAQPPQKGLSDAVLILPARMVPAKGQADLIAACASLRRRGVHAQVVLAGRPDRPEYEEQLRRQAHELGIEGETFFPGQLDREHLRNWYGASAILAFPTYHHEGLPRILLEAQAMELPVVAYGTGGLMDGIQEGKTGFIVPQGDQALLADRLELLLADQGRRRQMGKDARQFILERFSLPRLADRHEEYYLRCMRRNPIRR